MTHELALLAALFRPRMECVVRERSTVVNQFRSSTSATSGGTLLVQHNYDGGQEEIIVYAYDGRARRYRRTQLTRQGMMTSASSPGPANGVWTFGRVRWKRAGGASQFWAAPYTGICRERMSSQKNTGF